MSSKMVKAAFLILVACCTGWAHGRLPATTRAELGSDFVPKPWVADFAALGFDALVADYYWLQAVQIVGSDSNGTESVALHLGKLIDVVTTVNPHVDHPYRFAAVWLTHNEDQVRHANELLRAAIKYHPEEWRNHFYLGFNHFFYLREYEAASDALASAIGLPGAPAYLGRLAARLKSHQGDIEVAELFLRQLIESTTDEAEVAKLQSGLDEIEIEYKARHLDRARDAYRALAGRDIERVEDLVNSEFRILEKLPSAEPDAIPPSLSRGSVWQVDPKTDRISSSYVGARYEVHFSKVDQMRHESFQSASSKVDVQGGQEGDSRGE